MQIRTDQGLRMTLQRKFNKKAQKVLNDGRIRHEVDPSTLAHECLPFLTRLPPDFD